MDKKRLKKRLIIAAIVVSFLILITVLLVMAGLLVFLFMQKDPAMAGENAGWEILNILIKAIAFLLSPVLIVFAAASVAAIIAGIAFLFSDLKTENGTNRRNLYLGCSVLSAVIGARFIMIAVLDPSWVCIVFTAMLLIWSALNLACYFCVGRQQEVLKTEQCSSDVAEGDFRETHEEEKAVISFEEPEKKQRRKAEEECGKSVKKRAVKYSVLIGVDLVILILFGWPATVYLFGERSLPGFFAVAAVMFFNVYPAGNFFRGLRKAYRRRWCYLVSAAILFLCAGVFAVASFYAEFAYNIVIAAIALLYIWTGISASDVKKSVVKEYGENEKLT